MYQAEFEFHLLDLFYIFNRIELESDLLHSTFSMF